MRRLALAALAALAVGCGGHGEGSQSRTQVIDGLDGDGGFDARTMGAWVQSVSAGGPASKAGIRGGTGTEAFQGSGYRQGGDVITKVGDMAVTSPDDLATVVATNKPGATVKVEVHRGGATRVVNVKLTERPLGNPTSRSHG